MSDVSARGRKPSTSERKRTLGSGFSKRSLPPTHARVCSGLELPVDCLSGSKQPPSGSVGHRPCSCKGDRSSSPGEFGAQTEGGFHRPIDKPSRVWSESHRTARSLSGSVSPSIANTLRDPVGVPAMAHPCRPSPEIVQAGTALHSYQSIIHSPMFAETHCEPASAIAGGSHGNNPGIPNRVG